MCLAILTSIVAFTFTIKQKPLYYFYTFLSLLTTLLLYQPMVIIYIQLVVIYFVFSYYSPYRIKKYFQYTFYSCLALIVAFMVYKILAHPFLLGWGKEHQEMIPRNSYFFQHLWNNIVLSLKYFSLIFKNPTAIIWFGIPFIISVLYCLYQSAITIKNTKHKQPIDWFYIIILGNLPILLVLIMISPMVFLKNGVFAARFFIGFGPIVLFSYLVVGLLIKKWQKIPYLLIFPCCYLMIMSYYYGNIQKAQKKFEEQIVQYIAEDLKSLNQIKNIQHLFFTQIPLSPHIKLIAKEYPLLYAIIYKHLGNFFYWDYKYIQHYPIYKLNSTPSLWIVEKKNPEKAQHLKSLKPIKDNWLYSLKIQGDTALIEYHKQN